MGPGGRGAPQAASRQQVDRIKAQRIPFTNPAQAISVLYVPHFRFEYPRGLVCKGSAKSFLGKGKALPAGRRGMNRLEARFGPRRLMDDLP